MDNIEIFIGGDFYGGNRVGDLINNKLYNKLFGHLHDEIKSSDISIVNLESPLFSGFLKPITKTGPALKAETNVIEALEHAGFNILTLANNHILDYGEDGLNTTIELIKKSSLEFVGAGDSISKAREVKEIKVKDKKISIVNFCEKEWSIATEKSGGAAPFDIVDNYNDIHKAKDHSDFVIVVFHGGIENHNLPSLSLKKTMRFFVDAGADVIVCHHTHCVSGYEVYKDKPIFYGLGNFIFDMNGKRSSYWNIGIAVKLKLGSVISFRILPFKQCDNDVGIYALNNEEGSKFKDTMIQMNTIIQDQFKLEESFDNWASRMDKTYDSFLQPYSNRYIKALFNRGFMPSLLKKYNYLLLLNLIRCESHHEVLKKVLLNKLYK